jgi:hypothetical protein
MLRTGGWAAVFVIPANPPHPDLAHLKAKPLVPHLTRIFAYPAGRHSSVRSGMSVARAPCQCQAKLHRSGAEGAFGPTCHS